MDTQQGNEYLLIHYQCPDSLFSFYIITMHSNVNEKKTFQIVKFRHIIKWIFQLYILNLNFKLFSVIHISVIHWNTVK